MSKLTLNDVNLELSLAAATEALNENWAAIEEFSDTVLTRAATPPNQMTSNLDMNGYAVINHIGILTDGLIRSVEDGNPAHTQLAVKDLIFPNATVTAGGIKRAIITFTPIATEVTYGVTNVGAALDAQAASLASIFGSALVTLTDLTATFASSRRLVAGTNITFGTGTPGQLIISSSGGGGGSSPLTTKGDVWGYSTVDARIPIGSNGQVLTADSAQALGLKWATPAAASAANIDANTHPASPNAMDDEFEAASLDAKWTWRNQSTSTATLKSGSLILMDPTNGSTSDNWSQIYQTIGSPSAAYDFRCRMSAAALGDFNSAGLSLQLSSGTKFVVFTLTSNSGFKTSVLGYSNDTTYGSYNPLASDFSSSLGTIWQTRYYRIRFNGTSTWDFMASNTGLDDDSAWRTLLSTNINSGFFSGNPDRIGFAVDSASASFPATLMVDWFRKY